MTRVAPEAVLFDAGGTLIHMSPEKTGDILEPVLGVRPDPARMVGAHYVAMDAVSNRTDVATAADEVVWPFWAGTFLGAVGLPVTDEAVSALSAARGIWTHPIPGAAAALRSLRGAGIRVAVVSNADGTVRRCLEAAGFDGAYEFVVDSLEEGTSKPDPEIFLRALDRMEVAPERAWYVGDSMYYDVGGGTAAGLATTVLVDPLRLAPDYEPWVGSVAEVPALVGRVTS